MPPGDPRAPGQDANPATGVELSVVCPVFQAEGCLDELHRRLIPVLEEAAPPYEILLVDDGSHDGSWAKIEQLNAADGRIRGLRLSRNFGQPAAIAAGLTAARGQRVAVMDCDLQDRPEDLPQLLARAEQGHEVVLARRLHRKDSWFKRWTSGLFFSLMRAISGAYYEADVATFSVLSRRVVAEYVAAADPHAHFLSVLQWIGVPPVFVDVEHAPRHAGESAYSLSRLLSHAIDGIASQSTRLLHLSTVIGFVFSLLAVLQVGYVIYAKLFLGVGIAGWASLMAVLWLVGGVVLFSLGVIGLYLGRLVDRSRNMPLFVVRSTTSGS